MEKALGGTAPAGALSAAAPALFGARAADLTLIPPKRGAAEIAFEIPAASLAYFPPVPPHFVGRVAAMTRASTALAAEGRRSGVLFHGMAGAGKTSCAIELAYHHAAAGRFQGFVWYKAPEPGKDIALALRDLALAMEKQLPGFGSSMVHVVDRADELRDWLPRLAELLENNAVLIVLDNLESLLSETGQWRDERWGLLVEALMTPGGLSRTVLTSRIRPADLPGSVEVVAVHALARDEALLLVRELRNLRRLLDGKVPGLSAAEGRELVRRTLCLMQGHPKLIEFAEGQAAEPDRLAAHLDRAEAAALGQGVAGALDAFFSEGETRLGAEAFLASLRGWTEGIAAALPEAARTFFHFLCAVEEGDREDRIIDEANWAELWCRLGRPEPAPGVAEVLAPLVAAGLVEREATGADGERCKLAIHPGVAEAGRAAAGADFQAAVDKRLAVTWWTVMDHALKAHGKRLQAGPLIVRAGLAAFPYLSRLGVWDLAATMLQRVLVLDLSPATVAAVLPLARRLVEATAGTKDEAKDRSILARALTYGGWHEEAEALIRAEIAGAADREDFATASAVSGDLAILLRESGRYEPALRVVEQMADYTWRAGHGPWSQLADEGQRLQILVELGKQQEVLRRVMELRGQMLTLPDPPGADDMSINVWSVRETLLGIGGHAAIKLEAWQQALDLNAEKLQSLEQRGASLFEQARTRFNDYGPLLGLEGVGEARGLLLACRVVFERENAVAELGLVLGALSSVEDELNRREKAVHFAEAALRYQYVSGEPGSIAVSHHNVAHYLGKTDGGWHLALAHRLASVLIGLATGSGAVGQRLAALAWELRRGGSSARSALPADFAVLCAMVQQVEGVRFEELMARLLADQFTSGDELLWQAIAMAEEIASRGDGAEPPAG